MRLLRLTVQAVGPFVGRHVVDLEALGAGGLYLLEGPTGSGKSTLIDAIVFALYGKVAGRSASDDRVRSAFAADDQPTVVELVFEVTAGVFRVRRTPSYPRAKRRGSGTTTVQPTAALWRLPADWASAADLDLVGVPLATRLDEVGSLVTGYVGVDRAQFVQTVVLPQGEFAAFLEAKPEDRRVLLQRVFGTELYDRLAQRLVELRREGDRAVAAAREELVKAGERLAGAAGEHAAGVGGTAESPAFGARTEPSQVEPTLAARTEESAVEPALAARIAGLAPAGLRDASGLVAEVAGAVDEVLARTASAVGAARVRESAAREVWRDAEAALRATETRDAAVRRRDELCADLDALLADAPAQRGRTQRLQLARSAREVAGLVAAAQDARTAARSADKDLRAALDAAPPAVRALVGEIAPDPFAASDDRSGPLAACDDGRLGPFPPEGDRSDPGSGPGPALGAPPASADRRGRDLETLAAALDLAHDDAVRAGQRLDAAAATETGLAAARSAVRRLHGCVDDLAAELAEHDSWLAGRPDVRAALAAELAAAALAADGHPRALDEQRRAQADADACDRLVAASGALDAATAAVVAARGAAEQAVADEARLRLDWLAGLAGELAEELRPGDPCPVCGSEAHPAPALRPLDHPDRAAVDAAQMRRETAARTLQEVVAVWSGASARHQELTGQVGDLTPDRAAQRVTAASAEVARCLAAATEVERLRAALVALDEEQVSRNAARDQVAVRHTAESGELLVATDRLTVDEAAVAAARGDAPTVAARCTEVRALADWTDQLAGLLRRLGQQRTQARAAGDRLAEALAERGLPDAATVRDALLTDDQLADLDRRVADHEHALTATRTALADPELAGLPADLGDELAGAVTTESAARADLTTAQAQAAVAERVAAQAGAAAGRVDDAARALAAAVAAAAPAVRLAGLAAGQGGDNARGLSLASYVLARRFADVTAAANDRLTAMSDGRYALVPSATREDVGARTTGLAMQVADGVTGRSRDPRTLSGGEKFYVALSLALGLADVVTAEAGGIDLGTLVVDEGFGSLDAQVLDQVLAELARLREGGRTVAVVSHVEALKQAIADRVEVRALGDGSSTLRVLAGSALDS